MWDCAQNGIFSSEPVGATFKHELGHAAFGLADEYCCTGGYRQRDHLSNVFNNPQDCFDDVITLGGTPSDCRGQDSVHDADTLPDFWVSDPAFNDMMNDNQFARRADRRRILYVFGLCHQGKC